MNSEEDDDIINPEKLPIYLKGKEILDVVLKLLLLSPIMMNTLMRLKPVC